MTWRLVIVAGFHAGFAALLQQTQGHFHGIAVILAFGGWAFCVVALSRPAPPAGRWLTAAIGVAALYELYRGARFARLLYLVDDAALSAARALLLLALGLALMLAGLTLRAPAGRWTRAIDVVSAAAALALLTARALALSASPNPHIDVFTTATQGADFLLAGSNPYAQRYADIYAGAYDYPPGYVYPPGVLLSEAAARGLLGDIRWALIAADAVTALGLVRIAGGLGAGAAARWWPALLWLGFPAALFAREQAWVDPLLIAALVVLAALLLERRILAAGAALGYACSVKQYALIAAVLSVVAVAAAADRRHALRFSLAAVVVGAALTAPFVLADPTSFVRATITTPLGQGLRTDALTLTAGLARCCGVRVPGLLLLAASLAAIAAGAAHVRRVGDDDPAGLRAWCAACAFAYGVTFFLGKQAFLNYYELLLIFPVLWLALAGRGPSGVPIERAPRLRAGALP